MGSQAEGNKIKRLDLIEEICRQHPHLNEYQHVAPVINQLITNLRSHLINGDSLHISKLGSIKVTKHKARRVRVQGKIVVLPRRKLVKMTVGPKLKEELNEK